MPITLTCDCGKQLLVKDEHAGKKVRCPACQQVVHAPLLPTLLAPSEGAGDPFAVQSASVRSATPRPSSKGKEPPRRGRLCHPIEFDIIGDDLQMVEIELEPGNTVVAEAGAMTFMEQDIEFETRMGDGTEPEQGFFKKLFGAGKRWVVGESIFLTHFTNHGSQARRVAFAGPYPGKILPLNLAELGNELICQKDSFLCAAFGTRLDVAWQKKIGVGLFGGEGFILERLQGDGLAFIHACGALVRRELHGETLRIDTGCVVAFTGGLEYDIVKAGGLKSMFFGGEGFFLTTISGTGTVWLQSLPFSRLADRVVQSAPSAGGRSKEEGSVLGGLGRWMMSGNDD